MTPADLDSHTGDVQIVDVRWPNEWEAGRIEGAVHIPLDELEDRLDEIDRSRPVVTVCRTGSRSGQAAEELREGGFQAENLDGGMQAWADAGLQVTTPDGHPGAVVEPQPPPDDRPSEHQRLQSEFLSVVFAVQEHFGDREPSDEEVRGFLRQRLIEDGKSPEEADAFLARMDDSSERPG